MRPSSERFLAVLSAAAMVSLLACSGGDNDDPDPKQDTTQTQNDGGVTQNDMPPAGQEASVPDQGVTPDMAPEVDTGPPQPDLGAPLNITTPLVERKVAAVQYGSGQAGSVETKCRYKQYPDVCALKKLATDARNESASLIILPEYAIDQEWIEPQPEVGSNPGTNPQWPNELIVKAMSYHAANLGTYLIFDILTYTGNSDATRKFYNSLIAFDPEGKVVAVHNKFNLFGGEGDQLTAGSSINTFDHPIGKIGMLICADIYGSDTLLRQLTASGPALVAISSYWTVNNSVNWYSNYSDDYNVYSAVSNHTHMTGAGGGFWKPDGTSIIEKVSNMPHIMYAEIP